MAAKRDTADREIVIRRVIDAPRERVWAAWTDVAQLAKWYGPNGFTTRTRSMDAKPGGAWDFDMIGPDGAVYPNYLVYEELAKPERLAYSVGTQKGGPAKFQATVAFRDLGGKTEIEMRSVLPTAAARDSVIREVNAIEGGKQTLGRLAGHLGKTPTFQLEFERVVNAPAARVFEAWTKPEQLTRWFAPKPFQLLIRSMDLRPGGRFDMAMRGPNGEDFPFTGAYLAVEPPSRLCWSAEFPGGPPDQMTTLVSFEDLGGKTRVHALQVFHVMTPTIQMATRGAVEGWTMTLNQLEALFA